MRIIVINRENIEKIPPLISVVHILVGLGHNVTVITSGITDKNKKRFINKGVRVEEISFDESNLILKKVISIIKYRVKLKNILDKNEFDCIWLEGAGAFRMAPGIVDKYPFVIQISELYDYPEVKKVRKSIELLIHKAKVVVMPELHRAEYYRKEYKLLKTPTVLPNKPYFYLTDEEYEQCEKKYWDKLRMFKEKKVILYQGVLSKERDLSNYIKAAREIGDEYRLVLLGPDRGMLDSYKEMDSKITHIDFIPAPEYLIFTANAYIGILMYDGATLNSAYCAPNKIYEYGKYGLPMIGNNIPGLVGTIGKYNAGIIVDETSVESIKNAIHTIEENYKMYSSNAIKYFEDTDNVKTMRTIIDSI